MNVAYFLHKQLLDSHTTHSDRNAFSIKYIYGACECITFSDALCVCSCVSGNPTLASYTNILHASNCNYFTIYNTEQQHYMLKQWTL